MRTLIIGAGEVGMALWHTLSPFYPIDIIDKYKKKDTTISSFDIIHICFPYFYKDPFDNFIEEVKAYKKRYAAKYVVIHSTVPVGASRQAQALHSPVIGIHPHLQNSLKVFMKYIGGEQGGEVADYFRKAGMKVYLFDAQETTETMKILDTTFYGLCVEYTKDVKRICKELNIPFEAWTLWTDNYNSGYAELGHTEFIRPNLTPIMKKIGGHCILPNCDFLETKFTKFLKELNL